MKSQKIKTNSIILTFFIVFVGFGQEYKGAIAPIQKDGLHKIMLTSGLRAASRDSFVSLRLKDVNNQEFPYVLIKGTDRKLSTFKSMPVAAKKVIKDSITSIIIENKTSKKQEHITIRIANTKIRKRYTVYGSNNGTDWFGLVSNKNLTYTSIPNQTYLEETIHFPLNTYGFLKIDFNDKKSLPINVLEVGVYENKFFEQSQLEIQGYDKEVIEVKEEKMTQITFSSTSPNRINTFVFDIDTEFYLRNAKIVVSRNRKIKKRDISYVQVLKTFQLNSKNKNSFEISNLNEKEFRIQIDNKDNPPLTIKNITLYQKPLYLVANLKANQEYQIILDNSLSKPSYDLSNFISNKIENIEEAAIVRFSKIETKEERIIPTSFWQSNTFMWICITIGGLFVMYFAIGLLKDIDRNE